MLIGLAGHARSGKDTTFEQIDDYFNGVAKKISFARALKQSALAALGIDTDHPVEFCERLKTEATITTVWYDEDAANNRAVKITGREYLQRYGTEAHRDIFGKNFWVDVVLPKDFQHDHDIFVVTDVRFVNEAERIHELGGVIWQIDRQTTRPANDHSSEVALPDEEVDVVVLNHGSIEDLKENVYELLVPKLEIG